MDMHNAIYSVYIFSKMFGLAPYRIQKTKFGSTYTSNKSDKIFNDLVAIIICSSFFTLVYFNSFSYGITSVTVASKTLTHFFLISANILRLILSRVCTKKFTIVPDGLMYYDKQYKTVTGKNTYYNMTRVLTWSILGLRYAVTFAVLYYVITYTKDSKFTIAIQYLATFMGNNRFILFTVYAIEINQRFKRLNKFIKKISINSRIKCANGKVKQIKKLYSALFKVIYEIQFIFEFEVFFKLISTGTVSMLLLNQLSQVFSLILFWKNVTAYLFQFVWIILITTEICILIGQLVHITNQAKKTVQLMEDLERAVGKSNLPYKQVELFSLQVYVEDFKFSVFGCFPLDWTLLHSMVAGVATYLVIFHQFSNMEKQV